MTTYILVMLLWFGASNVALVTVEHIETRAGCISEMVAYSFDYRVMRAACVPVKEWSA